MPMIPKNFFKFIGVSLVFCTSVASTTPAAVTPNIPALLVPREVPASRLCGGAQWLYRECVPNVNPQAWWDVCRVDVPQLVTIIVKVYSSCPPQNVCANIADEDDNRSIKCVNIYAPGTSQTRISSTDPQIGSNVLQEAIGTSVNFGVDLTIQDDMQASVTGIFLSLDQSFALVTSNMVGKVQATGVIVCQGDQSDDAKARACYPTGRFGLKKGDVINFTWGPMTQGQYGSLEYVVWPS